MKVLHVTQSLAGGVASYFDEIALFQIRALGWGNVRFLIPKNHTNHVIQIPQTCIVTFPSSRRRARDLMSFWKALRRTIVQERPDIIHLHSTFAGLICRLNFLFFKNRPCIVYCPHGWSFSMEQHELLSNVFAIIERLLSKKTDRIINISHYENDLAKKHGLPPRKMTIVYNGVSQISSHRELAPVNFNTDLLNLLFIGRHDRQKGLDILLAQMKSLSKEPVHLHIVGSAVLSKAQNIPPEGYTFDNVTNHGWITRARIPGFLAACDALVVPSRWEGFGLVAAEAMEAGRAVIASNRGALPELVVNGETGWIFDLTKPSTFSALVRGLSKQQCEIAGKRGRERYRLLFTSERMNEELFAVYIELNHEPVS